MTYTHFSGVYRLSDVVFIQQEVQCSSCGDFLDGLKHKLTAEIVYGI